MIGRWDECAADLTIVEEPMTTTPHVCHLCGGDMVQLATRIVHARNGESDICPPPVDFAMFLVESPGDMDDPPALRCRRCRQMVKRLRTCDPAGVTLAHLIGEATVHVDHDCTYQGG